VSLLARLLRFPSRSAPSARPLDFAHALDLIRRASGGSAAWAVGLRAGDLETMAPDGPSDALRQRGAAIVQLSAVDGRAHVVREPGGVFVAVGDFPYGAGVLLPQTEGAPEATESVTEDLRRLLAGMRIAELETPEAQGELVAKQLALAAAGAQTLEGVARAGVEVAQQVSGRSAAVVLQEAGAHEEQRARVIAASSSADQRLTGLRLTPEAPAVRAMHTGLPVVTYAHEDVFGPGAPERRRRERPGTAYPLRDGHVVVGALVFVGLPIEPGTAPADRIARLAVELGPRLAAARALHEAEQRAVRDPLTSLRNRREFERALARYRTDGQAEPATLIYADLDRFKALNDTLGHAAGDAALRHVAELLNAAVRDGDLVARIGGEEFAVWLPRTPLDEGLEVAERIRRSLETTTWRWSGEPYALTISCGVAAYPVPVGEVVNLAAAADAALYRAKQAGRNRVEQALAAR
jgi:diguanylate cyclase (GGDEF)-like protein